MQHFLQHVEDICDQCDLKSNFFNLIKYLNLLSIAAKMQVWSLTVGAEIMIPDENKQHQKRKQSAPA